MALRYELNGQFVESCNCTVICPCWVDDQPTEEYCAGLFAWTFDEDSTIEGVDVGKRAVVSVTVHGDRRRGSGSESVLLIDAGLRPATRAHLAQAFAGRAGGALEQIAEVTGDVVDVVAATIVLAEEGDGWRLRVSNPDEGSTFVDVAGEPAYFDTATEPLQLTHTALGKELGIKGDAPVVAHRTSRLQIALAALPGEGIDVVGRSGMRGRFHYVGRDRAVDAGQDPEQAHDQDSEQAHEQDVEGDRPAAAGETEN